MVLQKKQQRWSMSSAVSLQEITGTPCCHGSLSVAHDLPDEEASQSRKLSRIHQEIEMLHPITHEELNRAKSHMNEFGNKNFSQRNREMTTAQHSLANSPELAEPGFPPTPRISEIGLLL